MSAPRASRPAGGGREAALPAGRVGRPHGLDGSFYVTRPAARLLAQGAVVSIGSERRTIVRLAGTAARPIVRLEGVESREAAQALRGMALTVDSSEAPRLQEGEWWAHELEGCLVLAGERTLGAVARMLELPSCEALEVQPAEPGSEPLIVPMVRDAILGVDVAAGRIEVDPVFLGVEPAAEPPGERG